MTADRSPTDAYVQHLADTAWDRVLCELIADEGMVIEHSLSALLVAAFRAGATEALADLTMRLQVVDVLAFSDAIGGGL